MGRLNDRIKRTSDNYYVNTRGYRDSRRRIQQEDETYKIGAGMLGVGLMLGIFSYQMGNRNLLYVSGGIFLYGLLIIFLMFRKWRNQ